MSIRSWLVPSLLCALAVVACDEEAPNEETAPAAASAKPITLAEYCTSICQHAAKCGAEAAAPLRGPEDAESEQVLREVSESCVASCSAEQLGEEHAFDLERAEICMRRTTCSALRECLDVL